MSVYLIRSDKFIKIGYSESPLGRIASMKTGNPHEMELLAVIPGDTGLEAYLHERFSHLRTRGEWFECTGLLDVFVNVCQAVFPVPETSPAESVSPHHQEETRKHQPATNRRLKHDTVEMMGMALNSTLARLKAPFMTVEQYANGVAVVLEEYRGINTGIREGIMIPLSIYKERMGGVVTLTLVDNTLTIFVQHAKVGILGDIVLCEMSTLAPNEEATT